VLIIATNQMVPIVAKETFVRGLTDRFVHTPAIEVFLCAGLSMAALVDTVGKLICASHGNNSPYAPSCAELILFILCSERKSR